MIVKLARTVEISIRGSSDDWTDFAARLRKAATGELQTLQPDQDADPDPYDALAQQIIITQTEDAKGWVGLHEADKVLIAAPAPVLEILASNAEFVGRELRSGVGAHIHIDPISYPDDLKDDSANVVFTLE